MVVNFKFGRGGRPDRKASSNNASTGSEAAKAGQQIIHLPIEILTASPHNARRHDEKQVTQLMACIRRFGFIGAVLVDGENVLIAGHGRVEAAKRLGMKSVPTILVEHLTPAEKRAFMIADNKLAENSNWDEVQLASEFKFLTEETISLDWQVEITGFETPEIDLIIDGPPPKKPKADPADDRLPPAGPGVSRVGDLWTLGAHRLVCGSALDPDVYVRLLGRERVELTVTDVPYNLEVAKIGGSGSIRHREFVQASGEMSDDEFTRFLRTAFMNMANISQDGSIAFIFIDWRHVRNLMDAAEPIFSKQLNLCIWDKGSGGMGTFYRSAHELIFAYKVGTAAHINNFGLGEKGRYRTNIWRAPGINSFSSGRMDELKLHPTVKPVSLIAEAIRDCSHRGGIVLDSFCGSGTILVAAEKTGRQARAIELDPIYVDTAVRRWQERFGKEAVLADTGQTFAEVQRVRAEPADTPVSI